MSGPLSFEVSELKARAITIIINSTGSVFRMDCFLISFSASCFILNSCITKQSEISVGLDYHCAIIHYCFFGTDPVIGIKCIG